MTYKKPQNANTLNTLLNLKGKNALIVGGAGLLGGEISYALAELGAQIFIASRNEKKSNLFIKNLQSRYPGRHKYFFLDISNKNSIIELFKDKYFLTNRIDILVNSGWSGNKNTLESISDDDWDYDIEVCLNGVFRTIKYSIPHLKKSKGVILNIASMYGHVAPDYRMYDGKKYANPPSYGAAKAGIIQLTKYCASFLAKDKIRVNSISPGPFPFNSTQKENPQFIKILSSKNVSNRIGIPEDLKGITAVLCSDAGSYLNGQNICIDGGWSIW